MFSLGLSELLGSEPPNSPPQNLQPAQFSATLGGHQVNILRTNHLLGEGAEGKSSLIEFVGDGNYGRGVIKTQFFDGIDAAQVQGWYSREVSVLKCKSQFLRKPMGAIFRGAAEIIYPKIHDYSLRALMANFLTTFKDGITTKSLIELFYPVSVSTCSMILDAISAMHTESIIHSDLKPENVFFSLPNQGLSQSHEPSFVLGDFGASQVAPPDQLLRIDCAIGTHPYMAPEVTRSFTGQQHNFICQKSDIWSLGVMMLETSCGSMHTFNHNFIKTISGSRKKPNHDGDYSDAEWANLPHGDIVGKGFLWNAIPPRLRQLICACLRFDPSERPTAEGLRLAFQDILPDATIGEAIEDRFHAPAVKSPVPTFFHMSILNSSAVPPPPLAARTSAPAASSDIPLNANDCSLDLNLTSNQQVLSAKVPAALLPQVINKAREMALSFDTDPQLVALIHDRDIRRNTIVDLLLAYGCLKQNVYRSTMFKKSTVPGYVRTESIIKLTEFGTRLQELGALDDFAAFWITVSNGDKMDL